jgi:hypothetical protein
VQLISRIAKLRAAGISAMTKKEEPTEGTRKSPQRKQLSAII